MMTQGIDMLNLRTGLLRASILLVCAALLLASCAPVRDRRTLDEMEEILDAWKDGIMSRFKRTFGEDSSGSITMSEEDFELAPYFFSGMKSKTISYLTGCSESSLRVRKTRIKQKVQALDDAFSSEKRLFLANL